MRPGVGAKLRRDAIVLAVVVAGYLLFASQVHNSYYQLMLTMVPIWAVLGLSWNLLSGYGGLTSFGHAAFFGIGAYTVTLCLVKLNLTPWVGIPIGMVLGAGAAFVIGTPTFRLRGHYFALAMLAYPLAILYVLQYLGYQEVSIPMKRENAAMFLQFSNPFSYTAIAVGLVVLAMFVSMAVENSRFGLALMAIRQNELAAEAAGIDTKTWKMRALMLSGALAAAAGGLYACVLLVVTPESVFGVLVSAQALVVTLFGGVATVWGPLIGAAILIPLAETLQAELGNIIPGIQGVVYGGAIIAIMLLTPEGLFWAVRDRFFRRAAPVIGQQLPPVSGQRIAIRTSGDGPILEVKGLSRAFGGLRAVDGVSFTVNRGEILGIIGPNGAGKTTLFNVMNGVLSADEGEAVFEGQRMTGQKLFAICRMGIGRTFQVVRSFPRLPVLDNVVVGAYGAGLADADAIASANGALAQVGLSHLAAVEAGQLTNKELRLMELARALAGQPRILLLDETLAGLGRDECDAVLTVLGSLRANGMTVVIIEHTLHAMMRIADRFLVLDHGKGLAVGAPREVVENREVIEAYLGKKWLARVTANV